MVAEGCSDSGSLLDVPSCVGEAGTVTLLYLYSLPVAAAQKIARLLAPNNTNLLSYCSEGHKTGSHWAKTKVSAGPVPSGGSWRDSFLALFTFQRPPVSLGP